MNSIAGMLFAARPATGVGRLSLAPSMRFPALLVLLLSGLPVLLAQDHILLMNGEEIEGRVLGQSTLEVRYLQEKRNGSLVERREPTSGVFSVTDSLGKEKVWYFMDTIFGNDLSVDQMRWFIKGEQDARRGYKPIWPMVGGFATGAGLTMALDLEVMSMVVPPAYAGLMALPRVHVTPGSISDPLMEGDPHYAYGYAQVGRSKRVVRSLWSTFAGVAVGLFVRQVIINPNLDDTP